MKCYITPQSEFLHDLRLYILWQSDVFEDDFIKLLICSDPNRREIWKHEIANRLYTLHGVHKRKHISSPTSDIIFDYLYTEQYPEISDTYRFSTTVNDICYMERLSIPDDIDALHARFLHCIKSYCTWISVQLITNPIVKETAILSKLDEITTFYL